MHDIWNPWHGCIKKSEGCENCYMYYLDYKHGKNGSNIYKSNNNFYYPRKVSVGTLLADGFTPSAVSFCLIIGLPRL